MNETLALTMWIAHASLIAFLIGGAWLAHRWPGVVPYHLIAIAATATVFLAGADCPLTVWENHFRAQAGWDPYADGFVVHYLVEPLTGSSRLGPWGKTLVVAAWVVPTIAGYLPRRPGHPMQDSSSVSKA